MLFSRSRLRDQVDSKVGEFNAGRLTNFSNSENEPNVIKIKEPVIIVGDIHGQFYDMIHMFEKVVDNRNLPKTNMLFLGDYVDRGSYSIEVCIFLFSLKINFPNEITLLRGNHESVAMTEHFTIDHQKLQFLQNGQAQKLVVKSNARVLKEILA